MKSEENLTMGDWIEFIWSGIPFVDWCYALKYKPTKVEKVLFTEFVKRPQREWLIATGEHFVYCILGFLYVYLISAYWFVLVGALALFVIVPMEFLLYKWKIKIFKGLSWRKLVITTCWNIFNAGLYWVLGGLFAVGLSQ